MNTNEKLLTPDEVLRLERMAVAARRRKHRKAFQTTSRPCYVKSVDRALKARDQLLGEHFSTVDAHSTPEVPVGLAGLALSGGGVRSATFNLGVLQRLHELGILQKLDYLSTVSGGGYIGCGLVAHVSAAGKDAFPFSAHQVGGEGFALRHLRRFSSYLVARGWLDALVAALTAVGGTLANILILIPFLLVLAVLATVQLEFLGSSASVWGAVALGGIAPLTAFAYVIAQVQPGQAQAAWSQRESFGRRMATIGGLALLSAVWMLQPVALERIAVSTANLTWKDLVAAATGLGGVAVSILSAARLLLASPTLRRPLVAAALVAAVLLLLWLTFAALGVGMINLASVSGSWTMAGVGLAAALLIAAIGRLLPTNCGSLHGFYRDRLSKAFFFKPWRPGAPSLEHADDCQLSQIDVEHCPYLLVNACLNVSDTPGRHEDLTKEYVRPGRRGTFFLFSREAVGNDAIGYVTSTRLEADNRLRGSLATAMAISGAAFGANMGYNTNPAAVMLLTLLNIRTGCWLRFPSAQTSKPWLHRLLGDYAYLTLAREALSRFDNEAGSLLLTDGGHVDNLGLYQLLKRRCALVIASDAEADPDYAFEGLAAAVRLAKIDLDVAVELDYSQLAAIRAGKRHFAVGQIHYPDAPAGTLIYIKSSLTDEALRDVSLLYYQRSSQSFPHETTADQFFTEQQFEAYRSLGHFACMRTFEGPAAP